MGDLRKKALEQVKERSAGWAMCPKVDRPFLCAFRLYLTACPAHAIHQAFSTSARPPSDDTSGGQSTLVMMTRSAG